MADILGRRASSSRSDDDEENDPAVWLPAQPLLDEEYFPRIVAVFYAIFHPTQGPTVVYQVPEGSISSPTADTAGNAATEDAPATSTAADDISAPFETAAASGNGHASEPGLRSPSQSKGQKDDQEEEDNKCLMQSTNDRDGDAGNASASKQPFSPLFDFKNLSEYIIPKAALCGRLISCAAPSLQASPNAQSYKILSHPVILYDQAKYPRNSFVFNLAFVFDGRADVRAYEPVVRKCARELRDLEQASSFLSKSQFRMYEVIEQIFEDLNTYYESFVAIPDAPHSKYVKTLGEQGLHRNPLSISPKNWSAMMRHQHPSRNFESHLQRGSRHGVGAAASLGSSPPLPAHHRDDGSRGSAGSVPPFSLGVASALDDTSSSKQARPATRRTSTDVALHGIASPPSLSNGDGPGSSSLRRGSSSSSTAAASSRPGVDRAKTFAALAMSETTVSAMTSGAASGGTLLAGTGPPQSPPNLADTRRSSAASINMSSAGPMMRSYSGDSMAAVTVATVAGSSRTVSPREDAERDGGMRELSESIRSLRAIVPSSLDALPRFRDGSEGRTGGAVGARPPAALLAPGKREPPHGLGRTVRDAINVKLFPTHPNPPEVQDWDVPVTLLDLNRRRSDNWDLTMIRVLPFVNGINHVKRIAQLADADLELTRQCIEHLLYYRCIIIIDTFQFSNIYAVRPTLATLAEDDVVISECASYVTKKGYQLPTWPTLLRLYGSLRPSTTLNDWIDDNNIETIGIDVRRFITFGVIKGFLRRVHRFPILLASEEPAEGLFASASANSFPGGNSASAFGGAGSQSQSRSRSRDRIATLRGGEAVPQQGSAENSNTRSSSREGLSPRTRYESLGEVFDGGPSRSRQSSAQQTIKSGGSGARRRHGIQLVQGQTHHHRKTQATVMDVANVALDAARGFADAGGRRWGSGSGPLASGFSTYSRADSNGSVVGLGRSGRAPLNRNMSSATIKAGGGKASGREGADESYNSRGIAMGSSGGNARRYRGGRVAHAAADLTNATAQPTRIPPEMLDMLDGTMPDDAFCVRFGRSWNEVLQMLVLIGQHPNGASTSGIGGDASRGLKRYSIGDTSAIRGRHGRSSDAMGSASDYTGITGGPGDETGAGESTIYQLSGIWGVGGGGGGGTSGWGPTSSVSGAGHTETPSYKGIRKTASASQDISKAGENTPEGSAPPAATPTVTFPSLPRYRPSGSGSGVQAHGHQSGSVRFGANSGTDGSAAGSGGGVDRSLSGVWGSGSGGGVGGGSSMLASGRNNSVAEDSAFYFDRRRLMQGDLGRVQIIAK